MQQVFKSMTLIKDFITTEEEESLFKEVEPHLKRQVYEKDHWDEVSYRNFFVRLTILILPLNKFRHGSLGSFSLRSSLGRTLHL